MLCSNPFMAGAVPFGCGQCGPCRISRRRLWTARQTLEALCHAENSFLTLTYDADHLPTGGTLVPDDVRLWLYKLRKACRPRRFRYVVVGEYGDKSQRPHYHLSLFGLSRTSICGASRQTFEELVQQTWGKGFTYTREFNRFTARYVAGYVTKKWTRPDHPALQGRHPEFARMSNRPGIGALAAEVIAQRLNSTVSDWATGDVPTTVRMDGKEYPIGRYLLNRIRRQVGFTEAYVQEVKDIKSHERSVEVLSLFADTPDALTAKAAVLKEGEGKIARSAALEKIWKQKRSI